MKMPRPPWARAKGKIACAACGAVFEGKMGSTRGLPEHTKPGTETRCSGSHGFGKMAVPA